MIRIDYYDQGHPVLVARSSRSPTLVWILLCALSILLASFSSKLSNQLFANGIGRSLTLSFRLVFRERENVCVGHFSRCRKL